LANAKANIVCLANVFPVLSIPSGFSLIITLSRLLFRLGSPAKVLTITLNITPG